MGPGRVGCRECELLRRWHAAAEARPPAPAPRADSCLLLLRMATRPSTAAILAAARAADGKRAAAGSSTGSSSVLARLPAAEPNEAGHTAGDAADSGSRPWGRDPGIDATDEPAECNGSPAIAPPSVTTILSEVRGGREGAQELGPASIREILAKVRAATGEGQLAPASIAGMLGEIRGTGGTERLQPSPVPQATGKAAPSPSKGRPSTAEILAAARKNTRGGAPAAGAAATTAPAGRPNTADILAAARRQGGGSAMGAVPASPAAPRPKPTSRPAKAQVGAQPAHAPWSAEGSEIRPKSVSEILASIRTELEATFNSTEADSLPPLAEMVYALRQLDARSSRRRRPPEPTTLAGRLRRWFAGDSDTHRGASI